MKSHILRISLLISSLNHIEKIIIIITMPISFQFDAPCHTTTLSRKCIGHCWALVDTTDAAINSSPLTVMEAWPFYWQYVEACPFLLVLVSSETSLKALVIYYYPLWMTWNGFLQWRGRKTFVKISKTCRIQTKWRLYFLIFTDNGDDL